jgi:hypothetical protein
MILVAALGMLAGHFGLVRPSAILGGCLCGLDDDFQIEEQKSAMATPTAGRVKGFGCRPVVALRLAPRAGVRKPPGKEPAGAGPGFGIYGDLRVVDSRGWIGSMAARGRLVGRAIVTGAAQRAVSRAGAGRGRCDGRSGASARADEGVIGRSPAMLLCGGLAMR